MKQIIEPNSLCSALTPLLYLKYSYLHKMPIDVNQFLCGTCFLSTTSHLQPQHVEIITNRTFRERFREHNAANQAKPTSLVAQHLKNNTTHKIDFDRSLNVLKRCDKKK